MNADRLRELAHECELQAEHQAELVPEGTVIPAPLVHAVNQALFLAQAHWLRAVAEALEEAA